MKCEKNGFQNLGFHVGQLVPLQRALAGYDDLCLKRGGALHVEFI
jgi:hypothetical protein